AVVRTLAQHGEAIRGIQEKLLGVPIQEELTALRSRVDIAKAETALLRAKIKTTEAIEKITCKRERQAHVEIEKQLAAVQESQLTSILFSGFDRVAIPLVGKNWQLLKANSSLFTTTKAFAAGVSSLQVSLQ
nr:Fe(2+) transport protein 3, chloroplastic-like [Tanacetum cinerariifolium]